VEGVVGFVRTVPPPHCSFRRVFHALQHLRCRGTRGIELVGPLPRILPVEAERYRKRLDTEAKAREERERRDAAARLQADAEAEEKRAEERRRQLRLEQEAREHEQKLQQDAADAAVPPPDWHGAGAAENDEVL
jgi:hypothetical protein